MEVTAAAVETAAETTAADIIIETTMPAAAETVAVAETTAAAGTAAPGNAAAAAIETAAPATVQNNPALPNLGLFPITDSIGGMAGPSFFGTDASNAATQPVAGSPTTDPQAPPGSPPSLV